MKNYLAKLRENEDKGFSLVELIIVMAIMAILVGVVASQVIPYMEKSRQSKDQQQLSGLVTDITSAIASSGQTVQNVGTTSAAEEVQNGISKLGDSGVSDASTKIADEFIGIRESSKVSSVADAVSEVKTKMKSKAALGKPSPKNKKVSDTKIYMVYNSADSKLTVFMGNGANLANAVPKLTVESE